MSATGHDVPGVMPYLGVRDAPAAIEFYKRAFGAVEGERLTASDGRVAHAAIEIGGSMVMLAEENAGESSRPRHSAGRQSGSTSTWTTSDAVFSRALALGAEERIPVADQFYGDRSGRLEDPFGHQWILATRKEQVSRDEMQRRFEAMMAGDG